MLYLLGGWPTNWRTIIPKKVLHSCEGSTPHIRLPSLGILPRDWESPGNLTLKASGTWLQDLHRTGGSRNKTMCAPGPRGKEHCPYRRLSQTYRECLRVSCRRVGGQWPATGRRALVAAVLGDGTQQQFSWRTPMPYHRASRGFPGGASGKSPPVYAGDKRDTVLIPGWRISWRRKCNPLQYSGLENPTDRGAWQATVHRLAKSQIWLKWLSTHCTEPLDSRTWSVSSQTTNREGAQPHPPADNCIKVLLSMALPTRVRETVLLIASPSHQEASISLFSSSTEGRQKQWELQS